jgi:6,7-dimethyl-8-ribityllumazine synthase
MKKIAIVVAAFNEFITKELLAGALSTLKEGGISEERIDIKWVPGAFELPLMAKYLLSQGNYSGVIALGCVIQGDTDHYQFICQSTAQGLMQVSLETQLPVIFGVLTTHNLEQAMDRIGGKVGHKGVEAAQTLLEMCQLTDRTL